MAARRSATTEPTMSEGARAACVIGWPVKHSRSPLIHGHWIKQHGLDAAYRREEIAPEAFADFIARSRRARLCRRQHHAAAQGGGAGAVGAGRPRARGRRRQHALVRRRAAAFDQHRRRRLHRQSRRCGAGLGTARRRSGRARRRRLGARRRLWPDRARLRQDPRGQPHAGARARRCASAFGAGGPARALGRRCRICSPGPDSWSTPPRSA